MLDSAVISRFPGRSRLPQPVQEVSELALEGANNVTTEADEDEADTKWSVIYPIGVCLALQNFRSRHPRIRPAADPR